MTESAERDLEDRFENIAAGSGRLYEHSFFGKTWLADYIADVDVAIDELRAEVEVERTAEKIQRDKAIANYAEVRRLQAEIAKATGLQEATLKQVVRKSHECDELRAEVEKWKDLVKTFSAGNVALEAELERLRAALTEMLESFTEPEDDNDILRRARAALTLT